MTLYIDIENKKLVQSLTSDRAVATPIFMQGDNEPLEIHLLEKGDDTLYKEKALVIGADFLRVAIARFSGYPKSLTYASGYTLNADGIAEVVLPLNTTAIENAVQDNEYISAFLEVEYSNASGRIVTVLQAACRVKNDLIENAPSIDLQDQFYDKVYTDEIFSKKSANLSDLGDKAESRTNLEVYSKAETDNKDSLNLKKASALSDLSNKATARANLDVYGKSETYNKTETDAQEALNLKKSDDLSDVADAAQARSNLDVPQRRDLASLGYSGILSASNLYTVGAYGVGIGDDFTNTETKLSFLTTYLPTGLYGRTLLSAYYAEYNSFYPTISADGNTLSLGTVYNYETENPTMEEQTLAISRTIEFGDKIALTVDGRAVKLYKNLELVASGNVADALYISNAANFLSWNGLKKELIYSSSMVLPATSAEGIAAKINYSIEDYVNGVYPPKGLLSSRFRKTYLSFPSTYSKSGYNVKGAGGASIGGKVGALKLSLNVLSYSASREFPLSEEIFAMTGVKYNIKFKVYLPTANPNLTKIQLRIGSYALASAGTIISKSDNIDNSGFISPKDEWQDIEITLLLKNIGAPGFYLYKGSTSYFKIEEETSDAVYLRDVYINGLQGIEGFFYGSANAGIWRNNGCSKYDLGFYNGYSLPCDGNSVYQKRLNIESFSNYTYEYFENFPSGMLLTQIILRFDGNVPDTSEAEDEYSKNIFGMYFDGNSVCEEQIPATVKGIACNIFPRRGFGTSISNIEIQPMYACQYGGTIDLLFTKIG